ncbi:MAG: hypothetical protein K0R07_558 [Sedimentibacter sp.]|jgi:hypothetical protein|nr:hypothetical protein [Sedimentibacter sp.]
MGYNDLEKLKKDYLDTPIPNELDFVVRKVFIQERIKMKRKNNIRKTAVSAASIAVLAVGITAGVNINPVFAENLSKVPVVGEIVKVLKFKEFNVDEDGYHAEIEIPKIDGLENIELENSLNEKYLKENNELYNQFMNEIEELKKVGGGHLGVDSGYVIKTDNDEILSIGRYVVNTVGSSSTIFKYDTIDKKNEILITLPSLFKDNSYVEIISDNIKQQMIENNKLDENKTYWVEGIEGSDFGLFEAISETQNFYINEDARLVISFDKYEVAPGYMGVLEFVIPTEILSKILVSDYYIK